MPKIIKNGLEYSGVPIEVVTAWAPTSDPVQVKEPLMGNTDISDIGDGSITGAISEINTGLTWKEILPWTQASANQTFTFSDTIENYHELLVEITVNNRMTTILLPVAQITSEPYTSTVQYIISMIEADSATPYHAYMQFYFASSATMVSAAANKTGWTGTVYTKVLAR